MMIGVLGYLVLYRTTQAPLTTRFLPGFLIIFLAMFMASLGPTYSNIFPAIAEIFLTAVESLSHGLFWVIAVTTIQWGNLPSLRVAGLTTAFYDLLSIVWVSLLFSLGVVNNTVILGVSILFVSLFIWLIDRKGAEIAATPIPPTDRRAELADHFGLSPREREVFMMLAQGRSRSYISETLVISEGTVKTHISHIYVKFGITNRQEMFDMLLDADSD